MIPLRMLNVISDAANTLSSSSDTNEGEFQSPFRSISIPIEWTTSIEYNAHLVFAFVFDYCSGKEERAGWTSSRREWIIVMVCVDGQMLLDRCRILPNSNNSFGKHSQPTKLRVWHCASFFSSTMSAPRDSGSQFWRKFVICAHLSEPSLTSSYLLHIVITLLGLPIVPDGFFSCIVRPPSVYSSSFL